MTFKSGNTPWNKGIKVDRKKHPRMGAFGKRTFKQRGNISNGHKGLKLSEKHKRNLSIAFSGKKNPEWKGNKVGYRALHHWVQRWLGKPKKCTCCGKLQTKSGKMIHWANKSHQYLRSLKDWISLCAKCHKAYDLARLEVL